MRVCPSAVAIFFERPDKSNHRAARSLADRDYHSGDEYKGSERSLSLCMPFTRRHFFGWQDRSATRIQRFCNPMTKLEKTSQMVNKKR
jgi:hypothetical protein